MKLDEKETIKKVTQLLSQYKTLKKISGECYVSKITPTYSFEPRSYTGSVSKPIEDHIVRQEAANNYVIKIEKAINSMMNADLRRLLIEKYVKYNDTDIAIYIDLGLSETDFYRLLEQAKIESAYYYDSGSLLRFDKGRNVKDLFDFLGEI